MLVIYLSIFYFFKAFIFLSHVCRVFSFLSCIFYGPQDFCFPLLFFTCPRFLLSSSLCLSYQRPGLQLSFSYSLSVSKYENNLFCLLLYIPLLSLLDTFPVLL